VPWLLILVLPFTAIDLATKAILVPVLAVLAEVLFWTGLALAGKETAQRYRRYFSIKFLRQKFGEWKRNRQKRDRGKD
jgi:hypothetical protein